MTLKEKLIQACSLTEEERDGTNKINSCVREFISTLDEFWGHKFLFEYSSVGVRQHDNNHYVEMLIKISNHSGSYSSGIKFLVPLLGFPCFFIDNQCEYFRCDSVEDIENQLIEWIKSIKPILPCVQD